LFVLTFILSFKKISRFHFQFSLFLYGGTIMAKSRGPRNQIRMKSTESHHIYYTSKNRRNQPARLEVKKYDPLLRKHVVYREDR